jgi:hypothetical protein
MSQVQVGNQADRVARAPLLEEARRGFEKAMADKDDEIGARERLVTQQEAAVAKARESVAAEVASRLTSERQRIAKDEAEKARSRFARDLEQRDENIDELQRVLGERDQKLAAAQRAQAALKRKERELDDARREMELTVKVRVQTSLGEVRKKALKEAEAGMQLKVAEREEPIRQMQRQIEELQQKAEQGSQQIQGEVQELALETLLRARFPQDTIEAVGKGQPGGDLLQHVSGAMGRRCATILWECKRTKRWSDGWLSKLRGDQSRAGAEAAILLSQVLPKGMDAFDQLQGVWVAEFRWAVPVATVMRHTLIELAAARQAGEGQQTKMELVYRYSTGPRFRERVSVIVERFVAMQDDLEQERRSVTRRWAKREEQIRSVIETTAGLYGDLQGIAGKSLAEIEGLQMNLLAPVERER